MIKDNEKFKKVIEQINFRLNVLENIAEEDAEMRRIVIAVKWELYQFKAWIDNEIKKGES